MEARASVAEGRISAIGFYGDFLARRPLDSLVEELRGTAFRREDVAAVLNRYPLGDFFGGITAEEVLETLFYVHG